MPIDPATLAALFPSLYSRRTAPGSDPHDWSALKLPTVRVMGPYWSFALQLETLTGEEQPNRPQLDLLMQDQSGTTVAGSALEDLHRTRLLRADIKDFWTAEAPAPAETLSLIAANVPDDAGPKPPLPISGGATLDRKKTSQLLLASIGEPSLNAPGLPASFHGAMRLVSGRITFKPSTAYLAGLRAAMGLTAPSPADDDTEVIVLLPDGVAFCGMLSLPWMEADDQLFGWFKLTRHHPKSGQEMQTVLRLWDEMPADRKLTSRLTGLVRGLRDNAARMDAKWFQLEVGRALDQSDLFWPCAPASTNLALFHRVRSEGHEQVALGGGAFVPRLRSENEPKMSITLDYTLVSRLRDGRVELSGTAETTDPVWENRVDAHYVYRDGYSEGETLSLGRLEAPPVETTSEREKTPEALSDPQIPSAFSLALPLEGNAQRMRKDMRFDDLPHPGRETIRSAPLWLFTPVTEGWLHWPFPNATTALLHREVLALEDEGHLPLTEMAGKRGEAIEVEADQQDRSAISFGSWRINERNDGSERRWGLSLFNAQAAQLKSTFWLNGDDWQVDTHELNLRGMSCLIQHLIPVTGFQQSPTHLIPEARHRALAPTGLDAATPDQLRELEAALWKLGQSGASAQAPYASATIPPLRLAPISTRSDDPPDGTSIEHHPDADGDDILTLTIGWPERVARPAPPVFGTNAPELPALKPWAWLRHKKLPTVQILPLCVAGSALSEPSSTRELAPLVGPGPHAGRQVVKFGTMFEMKRPGPELVGAGEVGPEQTTWQSPTAEMPCADEIGQAALTLPSLSFHVGRKTPETIPAPPDVWRGSEPVTWSDAIPTDLNIRIGYDLDMAAETSAFGVLPPPPHKPNNGPMNSALADAPPDPGAQLFGLAPWNMPAHHVWLGPWADRNRRLALAATEARTAIQTSQTGALELTDALMDVRPEVSNLSVSYDIKIGDREGEWPDDTQTVLVHAGKFGFDIDGDDIAIEHLGLPRPDDLTGLNVTLPRNGRNARLFLGALDHGPDDGQLRDQAGWTEKASKIGNLISIRKAERDHADRTQKQTLLLLTSRHPATLGDASFNAVDLPCTRPNGPSGDYVFAAPEEPGSGTAEMTRSGYNWALTQPPFDDQILVGQLAFRATSLKAARFDRHGWLVAAEFEGRVATPIKGRETADFVEGVGSARLIFDNGNLKIKGQALTLPIGSDADRVQPVPQIIATDYEFDGSFRQGALLVDLPMPGAVETLPLQANPPQLTVPNSLRLALTDIALPNLNDDNVDQHAKVTIELAVNVNCDGNLLTHVETVVLDGDGTETHSGKGTLTLRSDDPLIALPVALSHSPDDGAVFSSLLNGLTLGIALKTRGVGQSDPTPLLAGLGWRLGQGTVLAKLEALEQPGAYAVTVCDMALRCVSAADTEDMFSLAMDYDSHRNRKGVRISGKLSLANKMPLPAPDIDFTAPMWEGTLASNMAMLTHDIDAEIDGASLDLKKMNPAFLTLPLRAEHSVKSTDHPTLADRKLTADAYQQVTLVAANGFRSLADRFDGQSLLTHSDQTTDQYIATQGAMPHGLPDAWIASLSAESRARGCVVLAGVHSLLADADYTQSLLPASMPFVGGNATSLDALPSVPDAGRFSRQNETSLASGLPGVSARTARVLAERLAQSFGSDEMSGVGRLFAPLDRSPARATTAMFQGQSAVELGADMVPSDTVHPGLDTGLRLTALLALTDKALLRADRRFSALTLASPALPDTHLQHPPFDNAGQAVTTVEALIASWPEAAETAGKDHKPGVPNQADFLIPGPDARVGEVLKMPARVTLLAPGRSGKAIRQIAAVTMAGQRSWPDLLKWASTVLDREARWTPFGLLTLATTSGGDILSGEPPEFRSGVVKAGWASETTLVEARILHGGNRFAEPNRMALGPSWNSRGTRVPQDGLLDGFFAKTSQAEIVQSEPGSVLSDAETNVRLTATASVGCFAMGYSHQRMTVDQGDGTPWISDRDVVAPRPIQDFTADQPQLTPALPPGSDLPLPAALSPASNTEVDWKPDDALRKWRYVPAAQRIASVGGRAGVLQARRVGLSLEDFVRYGQSQRSMLMASTSTLWARTPRPVILGKNDRSRASAWEDAHMSLSYNPVAIMHGPGVPRDALAPPRTALDRSPRGKFAAIVEVVSPSAGLLDSTWAGDIEVAVNRYFELGKDPESVSLIVKKADLFVGSQQFIGDPAGGDDGHIGISGFYAAHPWNLDKRAKDAVRKAAPGSTVKLRLIVEIDGVLRVLRFTLFVRRGDAPLIEPPAFLRFDDPEYNDRLTSVPYRARRGGSFGFNMTMMCDRRTAHVDDVLFVGINADPDCNDDPERGWGITRVGGGPSFVFQRCSGAAGAVETGIVYTRRRLEDDGQVSDVELSLGYRAITPEEPHGIRNLVAFAMPLSDFRIMEEQVAFARDSETKEQAVLRPGDILTVELVARQEPGRDQRVVHLEFPITAYPSVPANPSAYGLMRLSVDARHWPQKNNALAVPLYARGSKADTVEMVDPSDLAASAVPRRATYYWETFQGPIKDVRLYAGLQKIGRIGATWLPSILNDYGKSDWQGYR